MESIWLEVEESANCGYMPLQVYEAHLSPVPVRRVMLEEPGRPRGVYVVTGWCSEDGGTPCGASYAPVSDSGQAQVHLVFGGDLGIRLKLEGSPGDWDLTDESQFGEPYLMLISEGDVLLDD